MGKKQPSMADFRKSIRGKAVGREYMQNSAFALLEARNRAWRVGVETAPVAPEERNDYDVSNPAEGVKQRPRQRAAAAAAAEREDEKMESIPESEQEVPNSDPSSKEDDPAVEDDMSMEDRSEHGDQTSFGHQDPTDHGSQQATHETDTSMVDRPEYGVLSNSAHTNPTANPNDSAANEASTSSEYWPQYAEISTTPSRYLGVARIPEAMVDKFEEAIRTLMTREIVTDREGEQRDVGVKLDDEAQATEYRDLLSGVEIAGKKVRPVYARKSWAW